MSALSHSNDDDRISPVQSDLKRLIKDTEQMFRDLTILRESDPMSLSSGVQLELAQAKERMLRVIHNTPATTNDPITEELKKIGEYEEYRKEHSTWHKHELTTAPAPYEPLIQGLLRVCLFIVVAYRASGKTNAPMALGLLITGLVKDSSFPVPIPRKLVVFSEDPEQINHILLGLAQLHGLDMEDIAQRIFVYRSKRNHFDDLKELKKLVEQYSEFIGDQEVKPLICFDTYAANFDITDENDNSQAAKVIDRIESHLPDYPVGLICHTAKADRNAKLEDITARGAGALESGAKAVFVIGEDSGSRFMINTKRRDRAAIEEVEITLGWHSVPVKDRFGYDQLIDLPMPSLKSTSKEERERRKQEQIETKDEPRIEALVDQALFFIRDSASRGEPKGQVMFRDHYRDKGGKAKDSIINEAHKRAMEIWRES